MNNSYRHYCHCSYFRLVTDGTNKVSNP